MSKSSVSPHLAQVQDLLNNYAYGGWVSLLQGGLGLEVLQVTQAFSCTASAVLRQSCRVWKSRDQPLTTVSMETLLLNIFYYIKVQHLYIWMDVYLSESNAKRTLRATPYGRHGRWAPCVQ